MNDRRKALIAAKKSRTLLDKIIKMMEGGDYCIDILQQILAVRGLLDSTSNKIMEDHLKHCFSQGIKSDDEKVKNKLISELLAVINLSDRVK